MKRVWTHFFSSFTLLLLLGSAVTTAHFNDSEGSRVNTLSALDLDIFLPSDGLDIELCRDNQTQAITFPIINSGSLPITYQTYADIVLDQNGVCSELQVEALQNGSPVFSGALEDFSVPSSTLESGAEDVWKIQVQLPIAHASQATSSSMCVFDTLFHAYQIGFSENEAFSDVEVVAHTIVTDTVGCTPTSTVNLYINKAISGDSQGYALSDFSYHVVGNGVDIVVPHDGTTPLPIGEYTITELVPEGFVKKDWRIGWYGQCERGSTFETTITVDEGNVDHGTLYCTADNQYRPGDDNGHHTEVQDPEENVPETPPVSQSETTERQRKPQRPPRRETIPEELITESITAEHTDTIEETGEVEDEDAYEVEEEPSSQENPDNERVEEEGEEGEEASENEVTEEEELVAEESVQEEI